MRVLRAHLFGAAVLAGLLLPGLAFAVNDCDFSINGDIIELNGSCTTDETIFVPDGFTLEGNGHAIRAVDPPASPFLGAIIENGGAVAHVRNLQLYTVALKSVCHGIQDGNAPPGADICDRDLIPDPRLKAVYFRCAGGSIQNVRVLRVHQTSASDCQEGSGIEVRNSTSGADVVVQIQDNFIRQYQKTGILVVGGVQALVEKNLLLARSSDRAAPNGIQISDGASANVVDNGIFYNRFTGLGFASAGIILDAVQSAYVEGNSVTGNDIGIWVLNSLDAIVEANVVRDSTLFGIAVDDQAGAVEKAVVMENDIERNLYGIGIFGVNTVEAQVIGNRLKGNEVGVYSGPAAVATGLISNTIWNSTDSALVVDGAGATVQGNSLFGNDNASITINGDDNAVLQNSVRQAGTVGIQVDGTGNRVEANDAQVSGTLDIDNVGVNTYVDNVCESSSGPPVDCGQ